MATTLLIGDPTSSWREWHQTQTANRDLFLLHPNDSQFGPPGQLRWIKNDQVFDSQFFGSLDPLRFPQILLTALAEWLGRREKSAQTNLIIQLFPVRPSPAMRHLVLLIAQLIKPTAIIVSESLSMGLDGFPIGPQIIKLEKNYPEMVLAAQRKAQWLRLIEKTETHTISLSTVTMGARLGSGMRVTTPELVKVGIPEIVYAERQGSTLFVVTQEEISDHFVSRALDITHTRRIHMVRPTDYNDALVSFARPSGEDFGLGTIQTVDWVAGTIIVKNTAAAPTPVALLKLGVIRIDSNGNEREEAKPWSI